MITNLSQQTPPTPPRKFNGPARQPYVFHIMRTDCHQHTGLVRALCGYTALSYLKGVKLIRTNALPCRTCQRLAKPGVNC